MLREPLAAEHDDTEALAAAIARRLTPPPSPLLDAEEASALLNVPASWLMTEARAKRCPSVTLGKYRRFKQDELLAWVEARVEGPRRSTRRTT
jgi:excisionase family DNA binding protein